MVRGTKRGRAAAQEHEPKDEPMEQAESSSDSDDDDSEDELTFDQAEAMDEDDSDDDDGDDADERGDGSVQSKSVNVDFVFSDPREDHFHSVKQFLLSYLPSSHPFDVSGLANLIVSQVATGTMVGLDGEADVYGFITALSLQRYKDETSVQQILQYVQKKCPSALLAQLQHVLQTKSVALVVNERMVNLPYQLVPALHSALHEDIEWAIENEETPAMRASYNVEYFLMLSSCTKETASSGGGGKKAGKKAKNQYEQTATFFTHFEDEFIEQDAEIKFTFDTPRSDRDAKDQSNKSTVVLLVERARHKAALANIAAMINM